MSSKTPDKRVRKHALHVVYEVGKGQLQLWASGHAADTLSGGTTTGGLTMGVQVRIWHIKK